MTLSNAREMVYPRRRKEGENPSRTWETGVTTTIGRGKCCTRHRKRGKRRSTAWWSFRSAAKFGENSTPPPKPP